MITFQVFQPYQVRQKMPQELVLLFYLIYTLFVYVTKDKYFAAWLVSIFAAEKVKIRGHNPRENANNFKKVI